MIDGRRYPNILILAVITSFLSSCVTVAPISSNFDSTKSLMPGQLEATGFYSRSIYKLSKIDENSSDDVSNNNFGIRLGYGIIKNFDLKVSYTSLRPNMKIYTPEMDIVSETEKKEYKYNCYSLFL